MITQIALLGLPVITGLASVYWAKLVGVSWSMAPLANVFGYGLTYLVVVAFKDDYRSTWTHLQQPNVLSDVLIYSLLSMVVSLCWMFALKDTNLAVIGFVEIAYPLFIVLFTALLIGNVQLQPLHWLGCALIFLGAMAVVLANVQVGK